MPQPLPEPPRALQTAGLAALLLVLAACAWIDYQAFRANIWAGLAAITIGTPAALETTRRATLAALIRYARRHHQT